MGERCRAAGVPHTQQRALTACLGVWCGAGDDFLEGASDDSGAGGASSDDDEPSGGERGGAAAGGGAASDDDEVEEEDVDELGAAGDEGLEGFGSGERRACARATALV